MESRLESFDSFLPDPGLAREFGLNAPYIDWTGQDGEVYKRVCVVDVPGLRESIESKVGQVEIFMQGYRLNFNNEMPNAAIHSDLGWGTHAAVVYLCDGPGGTAFWRHRATGATRIDRGDTQLFEAVRGDWNREEAWEMTALCELRFNRGVIYDGTQFHSRYPFAAFGSDYNDGRLVAVAFFTPLEK